MNRSKIPTKTGFSFERVNCVLAAALLFLAWASPTLAQNTRNSQSQRPVAAVQDPLDQYNDSVEALVKKVWPSVVQILVTSYGPREEGGRGNTSVVLGRQSTVGSGFV